MKPRDILAWLIAMALFVGGTTLIDVARGEPSPSARETEPQAPPDQAEPESKRGERSSGVITPPPIGDEAAVKPPPPHGTRMPVIPPPGAPGGDPNVQPK